MSEFEDFNKKFNDFADASAKLVSNTVKNIFVGGEDELAQLKATIAKQSHQIKAAKEWITQLYHPLPVAKDTQYGAILWDELSQVERAKESCGK